MTTIRDLLNEREPNFAEEAELKQEIEETTLTMTRMLIRPISSPS